MADTHETIADIIAWLRIPREGENAYLTLWRDEIADRIEAAHRRESVTDRNQFGDAAKLREALVRFYEWAILDLNENAWIGDSSGNYKKLLDAMAKEIAAALAVPPRNCDVPFIVEGTTWNIADKVWRVFRQTHPDAYFDTPNLVRCINWLFSPAAEKEGGDNGNE